TLGFLVLPANGRDPIALPCLLGDRDGAACPAALPGDGVRLDLELRPARPRGQRQPVLGPGVLVLGHAWLDNRRVVPLRDGYGRRGSEVIQEKSSGCSSRGTGATGFARHRRSNAESVLMSSPSRSAFSVR